MALPSITPEKSLRTLVLGTLSYMGALCFIPLLVSDKNEFILFHARQGLVLWGWTVLAGFLLILPGIGKPVFIISLSCVIGFSVLGILAVGMRKTWRLPLIYKLSTAI